MHKHIYGLLLLIFPLVGLYSCKSDDIGGMSPEGNVPVEFSFNEPIDGLDTRGPESYKQRFEEGDVIHVLGTFTSFDGETVKQYGAMRLTSRKWEPIVGATLYWPYEAEKGSFKAYYLANSDYLLSSNSSTPSVKLEDVKDDEDPLEAQSVTVPYGYAVDMQFTHACTYLTLEKLEQNVSDYYWMVFPGQENIKNAYQLTRKGDNLELEFISIPDPTERNLVYISRPSESYTDTDGQRYSMASFYLAPGDYSYFDLRTNSNFPFMSFLNSLTEPLLANHPYTLNVKNAKGANYEYTTEYDWDTKSGAWQVDVPKFLEAVANGNEYTETDDKGNPVPILKKGNNGTLILMQNLDFQNYNEYGFDKLGFYPDVPNGTTINGNLHYIVNIGHPIFRFNFGTIENLGLKDLNATVVASEGVFDIDYSQDFSRVGGLCYWNRSDARIENVRMENFNLTVNIKAENPETAGHNENYSIGALSGDNAGFISDINLKGNINITVQSQNDPTYPYVDANINIGGILGNNTATLSNVGPELGEDFKITINNNCRGRQDWGSGIFCTGGAVGMSNGNLSQIVINDITINAEASDGYQIYTGGLAGRLRSDNGTVSDCTVQGSLTCGTVSNYASFVNSLCYMGGISGNVRGYTVSNCRAVCNVNSNMSSVEGIPYATGGAFGRIQEGCALVNCSAYGNQLTGPQNGSTEYVGLFAGIANLAYTWADLEANGNSARTINGYDTIGASLDDNSNE